MVDLVATKLATRTTKTRYNFCLLREGKRAQKLTVIYSANITQPMHSPFTHNEEELAKALTRLQILLVNGCSNAILLRKYLASY
jgi:hypothetical protein